MIGYDLKLHDAERAIIDFIQTGPARMQAGQIARDDDKARGDRVPLAEVEFECVNRNVPAIRRPLTPIFHAATATSPR